MSLSPPGATQTGVPLSPTTTTHPADIIDIPSRYVTYTINLPEHALAAVKILLHVSQSPLVQPKLVGLFTASPALTERLLHGFVECLEVDDVEEEEEMDHKMIGESGQLCFGCI